ncbi:MAG: IS91 family transposase [Lachnospiraceae bacterium]|nr:IS91 family transposase [Lachnospiraceae bacterium]
MAELKIQQIFRTSWNAYAQTHTVSSVQHKAALSIMACKSGSLGCSVSVCEECGYKTIHNNSCRNRSCPSCQAVLKECWIDARRSEVIDGSYYHVVFPMPAELRPLIYTNQKLLYSLMHETSAGTLLELSRDRKYLGAVPAVIQVLHTWGQELNYHPHIHCIVSGTGLTDTLQLKSCSSGFFIPVKVLGKLFRGKFLHALETLYRSGRIILPISCQDLSAPDAWDRFRDALYRKDWCPYIKETFNGFGNAIDYLGRYTHRIAISNARIEEVTEDTVTFRARDYRTMETRPVTLTHEEFIRRFLQHVLPKGFQKIRYYGLLSNSRKKKLLTAVFRLQGHRKFQSLYTGMDTERRLMMMFGIDIRLCPCCGCRSMRLSCRTFSGSDPTTG